MDGVLADFDRMVAEVGQVDPRALQDSTLWEAVLSFPHWFSLLEPMPEAYELMSYVCSLNVPVAILTALPRRRHIPYAEEDKRQWITDHWGPMEFHVGPYAVDKQAYAQPGYVLIDDSRLNIPQWRAQGGYGILYENLLQTKLELEKILHASPVEEK